MALARFSHCVCMSFRLLNYLLEKYQVNFGWSCGAASIDIDLSCSDAGWPKRFAGIHFLKGIHNLCQREKKTIFKTQTYYIQEIEHQQLNRNNNKLKLNLNPYAMLNSTIAPEMKIQQPTDRPTDRQRTTSRQKQRNTNKRLPMQTKERTNEYTDTFVFVRVRQKYNR